MATGLISESECKLILCCLYSIVLNLNGIHDSYHIENVALHFAMRCFVFFPKEPPRGSNTEKKTFWSVCFEISGPQVARSPN